MATGELQRSLGKWELVFFAVMTMVPIAPMGIYGVVAQLGHGHVPLIYLLGAGGMAFTAWGYGQFAKRYPNAGSVYAYVGETLNSHIGFFTGWAILLDYFLIPGLVILVSARWLQQATGIGVLVWGAIFIVGATYLNIRGIEMTITVTKILFVFEVFVFAVFSLVATYTIVTDPALSFTLQPFYNPATFSTSLILSGASVAVLSFLGFDVMTTLAEETREARTNVSQAVVIVVPLMAFFFVVQTYLAALLHPGYQFQNAGVAFYFIARQAGGQWLQFLALAGTVAAWGGGDTLATQAAISRILMAMGREGHLPSFLARVHPEYKTPYISVLVVAVISFALLYVFTIQDLSSLVNFGALTAFALMDLALGYRFLHQGNEPSIKALIPAIGFVLMAAIWYGLSMSAKTLGIGWLVVGVVYIAYVTRGFQVKTRLPVEEG